MEDRNNNKSFGNGIIIGIIIGILVVGIPVVSISLSQLIANHSKVVVSDNTIDKDTLKKIENIKKIIDSNLYIYNEEITADNLEEGIYRGMIESLGDKYAEYYSAEEMQGVIDGYEGVSYGIGCYVTLDAEKDVPVVYGIIEGSPAEEAGVKEGDIIVSVEDEAVAGYSLTKVVSLIKGLDGTDVHIVFNRDGEMIEKTITRGEVIETTSVESGVLIENKDIGYIHIMEFDDATVGQYQEAMNALKEEKVKGIILDLRSNPGGNLNAVVDIARQILPEGIIVYTEDNRGIRKDFTCDGENELDLPLVVLINEYSASASEILSGAIQDYNKGTLLGTTTYGKGIVQSLLNVGDGSVVKITTSAYFTPSGRNIQGSGIEPDIKLEYDRDAANNEGRDNQIERAKEILEDKIGE